MRQVKSGFAVWWFALRLALRHLLPVAFMGSVAWIVAHAIEGVTGWVGWALGLPLLGLLSMPLLRHIAQAALEKAPALPRAPVRMEGGRPSNRFAVLFILCLVTLASASLVTPFATFGFVTLASLAGVAILVVPAILLGSLCLWYVAFGHPELHLKPGTVTLLFRRNWVRLSLGWTLAYLPFAFVAGWLGTVDMLVEVGSAVGMERWLWAYFALESLAYGLSAATGMAFTAWFIAEARTHRIGADGARRDRDSSESPQVTAG